MSYHGHCVEQALAKLLKLKDAAGLTYRSCVYKKLGGAAGEAIGGSCWAVEAEVALRRLQLAVDSAIDADPVLQEIFDVALPRPFAEWAAAHPLPPFPPAPSSHEEIERMLCNAPG